MQKALRARVREDRRLLELPEPVPEAAGSEVEVSLTVPEPQPAPARRDIALPTRRLGPMSGRLTRREIYEDVG